MAINLRQISAADLEAMPREARIELLLKVWNSLFEENDFAPVSVEIMQVLDERLAEYEADPNACIPWEEVLEELRGRK